MHGWEPAAILGATRDTPIWKANRRANFTLTEEGNVARAPVDVLQ